MSVINFENSWSVLLQFFSMCSKHVFDNFPNYTTILKCSMLVVTPPYFFFLHFSLEVYIDLLSSSLITVQSIEVTIKGTLHCQCLFLAWYLLSIRVINILTSNIFHLIIPSIMSYMSLFCLFRMFFDFWHSF